MELFCGGRLKNMFVNLKSVNPTDVPELCLSLLSLIFNLCKKAVHTLYMCNAQMGNFWPPPLHLTDLVHNLIAFDRHKINYNALSDPLHLSPALHTLCTAMYWIFFTCEYDIDVVS